MIAHSDDSQIGATVDADFHQKTKGRTVEFKRDGESFLATGAQVGSSGWYVNIMAPIDGVSLSPCFTPRPDRDHGHHLRVHSAPR